MINPDISRRGVYYNLDLSPYEFHTPCGVIFKFSSAKKLEIYTRRLNQLMAQIIKLVNKHEVLLGSYWKKNTLRNMEDVIYQFVYSEVEKGLWFY